MNKLLIGLPLILALLSTGALAQERGRGGYGRGGGYAHPDAGASRGAPAFARPNAERGYGGVYGGPGEGGRGFGASRFGGDRARPDPGAGYGGRGDRARPDPGAGYGGRGYGGQPAGPAYGRGGYPQERFAEPAFRGGPAFNGAVRSAPGGPGFGRPGPARGFTRGQVLPQAFWGGEVADPRIYHLRRPPSGYGWVTVGETAYLTQRSTGLILDTAPLY